MGRFFCPFLIAYLFPIILNPRGRPGKPIPFAGFTDNRFIGVGSAVEDQYAGIIGQLRRDE